MKKSLSILCVATLAAVSVNAQDKKKDSKKNTKEVQAVSPANSGQVIAQPGTRYVPIPEDKGFIRTPNGMEYKIVHDETKGQKPQLGDWISAHLLTTVQDSVIFSTREVLNNMPAEVQMMAPPGKGDVMEGFTYMTPGDSAIFRLSVDSLLTLPGVTPTPWMKRGINQKIYYYAVLAGVKTNDDKQKEMAEMQQKQKDLDDVLMQDYFKANNIKPTKTTSGLYYTIAKEGKGAVANIGDTVVVNYTGSNMGNGTKFDSNVDSAFGHAGMPFEFPVGMRRVIAGWDEGFSILKKGTKATLYIPSHLAYGANSPDPSRIPPNGILIFDVELVNIKPQAPRKDIPNGTPPPPKKN